MIVLRHQASGAARSAADLIRIRTIGFVFLTFFWVQHGASQVLGQSIQVVSPSAYADVEADSHLGDLTGGARGQQVFPASDFESLPAGYQTITRLAFRPSVELKEPLQITFHDLQLHFSTTNSSPQKLSLAFADNIGPDETVVFQGDLTYSTANVGPPEGPREFDYVMDLQTPFTYDPNEGDLLMETDWSGVSGADSSLADFVFSPGPDAHTVYFDGDPAATTAATEWGGIVTQFTFEPEPTTFSFRDDFEDGNMADGNPVTWAPGRASGGTREVIGGDLVMQHNDIAGTVVEGTSQLTDVSIRTQLRVLDANGWVFPAVFARSTPNPTRPSLGSFYWGGILGNGDIAIGETHGNSDTTWQQVPTSLDPFVADVVLQLDVEGDEISLTAWEEGQAEPDVPTITHTDDSLTSGSIGVGLSTGNDSRIAFRYFEAVTDAVAPGVTVLQPGDADMNLEFDQLDLVQVQIAGKYLTGQPATWGEGDWDGAPGGSVGSPPAGDGQFNMLDVIAALGPGVYLTGPYAAVLPGGQQADGQTCIVYDTNTGELAVDAPAAAELTSVNIDSASGIFTATAAENLGGSFDNDSDSNVFKATFGSSFGSLSFGQVAQAGLSEQFVLQDLSVVGSLQGGGALGQVDLVYVPVPEPASVALLIMGMMVVVMAERNGWESK